MRHAAAARRPLNKRQKDAVRKALLLRRRALLEACGRGVREAPTPAMCSSADEEEACRAICDTEMQYAIVGIRAATLAEVETALLKLRSGSYGVCECCGDQISMARLHAQPFSSLCIECKREAERQAASAAEPAPAGRSFLGIVGTGTPITWGNVRWNS